MEPTHRPRQPSGPSQRLGEEAADAAECHAERHGRGEQVARGAVVPGQPLAHQRAGVGARQAAEDALRPVAPGVGHRRGAHVADVAHQAGDPHPERTADQGGGHDHEEPLVERPRPPHLRPEDERGDGDAQADEHRVHGAGVLGDEDRAHGGKVGSRRLGQVDAPRSPRLESGQRPYPASMNGVVMAPPTHSPAETTAPRGHPISTPTPKA